MSQSLPSPPIVFESEIENVALNTETVAGIRAIASSGQDPPDRVIVKFVKNLIIPLGK
jgi:hypothetical protein